MEDHTPFARRYSPGEPPLPSDDAAAAMYCAASTVLRGAGPAARAPAAAVSLGRACVPAPACNTARAGALVTTHTPRPAVHAVPRCAFCAGFEHYEVSNYALPGHRCRHNMVYWQGGAYYAAGMGAASYLRGRRFSRPKRLAGYRRWVEQYAADAAAHGPQVRALGGGGGRLHALGGP